MNLLKRSGLTMFRVESLATHGGSNRIYCARTRPHEKSVQSAWDLEKFSGLDNLDTYDDFATRVETSKRQWVHLITRIKESGKKIVAYGATSKLTVVTNYCGLDSNYLDYVIDTTPAKQNKLMPGTHIEIVSREESDFESADYALLGAWNYKDEIMAKERKWINNGGRFITHVPFVHII
jgi:methylation protein EvaC